MPINLNEAPEYREMGAQIPDGSFVWVSGVIRRDDKNTYNMPGFPPEDNGIFKKGREGDTYYTDWEFTVTHGPHTGSKIWQNMTLAGGQMDDKGQSKAGNITKSFYRGMVESAFGILPSDMSEQAKSYRNIPSITALVNVAFAVKTGVQAGEANPNKPGEYYPDRTTIQKIILPDDPHYARMKAGEQIPPEPSGTRPARSGGGAGPAPAGGGAQPLWQQQAAETAAPAPVQQALPQPGPATMPAAAPVAAPAPAAAVAAAWGGQPAAAGPVANGQAGPVAAGPQPAAAPAAAGGQPGPAWLANQG